MSGKTFDLAWSGFMEAVGLTGKDVPEIQKKEMKRAFFAGAWATLLLAMTVGENTVSEDEGVRNLESWRQELQQFQQDVLEGKA